MINVYAPAEIGLLKYRLGTDPAGPLKIRG